MLARHSLACTSTTFLNAAYGAPASCGDDFAMAYAEVARCLAESFVTADNVGYVRALETHHLLRAEHNVKSTNCIVELLDG